MVPDVRRSQRTLSADQHKAIARLRRLRRVIASILPVDMSGRLINGIMQTVAHSQFAFTGQNDAQIGQQERRPARPQRSSPRPGTSLPFLGNPTVKRARFSQRRTQRRLQGDGDRSVICKSMVARRNYISCTSLVYLANAPTISGHAHEAHRDSVERSYCQRGTSQKGPLDDAFGSTRTSASFPYTLARPRVTDDLEQQFRRTWRQSSATTHCR